MKKLKIIVNHSQDQLKKNLEKFINYPQRVIHKIDFRPVAAPGGGIIHATYIIYEEGDADEKLGEHKAHTLSNPLDFP